MKYKNDFKGAQSLRRSDYIQIFQNISYRPTVRELGDMLGYSGNQVSKDIRELGLTKMWKSLHRITATERREQFYLENYFNKEKKPSCSMLGRKLFLTRKQVAEDIRKLKKKYGIE